MDRFIVSKVKVWYTQLVSVGSPFGVQARLASCAGRREAPLE